MKVERVDPAYRIGFDRTSDAIEMIPVSGDQYGEDICELIGICTAALLALGDRWGTDQMGALRVIEQLL
jgi:hypothetical protein